MKVLLDEDVPHDLRPLLTEHDVFTAAHLGWAGVKNGSLLKLVEESGFDVFVTADQNLSYQQNLSSRAFGVVVLGTNRWPDMKVHVGATSTAILHSTPSSLTFIEM
jgi:hypothetical protein